MSIFFGNVMILLVLSRLLGWAKGLKEVVRHFWAFSGLYMVFDSTQGGT